MPAIGDVLAGRYRIDARLGAGGMATVWQARDLRLERDVAVKVLLPNLAGDPALAARFDREARALAALADPHVVGIHDVVGGDAGTEPFLVMELCPDGSLGDRLADGAALSFDDALPLLADAAAGLASLHAAGIVHRDVTPRNVLLAGGRARIGDLGLARAGVPGEAPPGSGLTATGTAVGTLAYLAPEVLHGEVATPASDLYALGAVAYRTLTGILPHPAGTIAEVVTARDLAFAPLARMAPGTPSAVADLVDRALAIDPTVRPTAAEAAAILAQAARARGEGRSAMPGAPDPTGIPSSAAGHPPDLANEPTVIVALPGASSGAPGPGGASSPIARPQPSRGPQPTHGRHPLPEPGPGYHGPGLWSGELVAVVVVAVAIVLLVILLGGGPFGGSSSPGPTGSPTGSSGAVVTVSPTPMPAPTAAPSPTPAPTAAPTPTPDPFDAAAALVGPVRAAIDAAKGPDGLKGKDVKGLDDALSAVAAALAKEDASKAIDATGKLDERVRALLDADAISGDPVARLASAVADLVAAVGALP